MDELLFVVAMRDRGGGGSGFVNNFEFRKLRYLDVNDVFVSHFIQHSHTVVNEPNHCFLDQLTPSGGGGGRWLSLGIEARGRTGRRLHIEIKLRNINEKAWKG